MEKMRSLFLAGMMFASATGAALAAEGTAPTVADPVRAILDEKLTERAISDIILDYKLDLEQRGVVKLPVIHDTHLTYDFVKKFRDAKVLISHGDIDQDMIRYAGVWDDQAGFFSGGSSYHDGRLSHAIIYNWHCSLRSSLSRDEFDILTSIKDRDGKTLYEGDYTSNNYSD